MGSVLICGVTVKSVTKSTSTMHVMRTNAASGIVRSAMPYDPKNIAVSSRCTVLGGCQNHRAWRSYDRCVVLHPTVKPWICWTRSWYWGRLTIGWTYPYTGDCSDHVGGRGARVRRRRVHRAVFGIRRRGKPYHSGGTQWPRVWFSIHTAHVVGARPTTRRRDERCKYHIVAMGRFVDSPSFIVAPLSKFFKMFGLRLDQSETLLAKGFFHTCFTRARTWIRLQRTHAAQRDLRPRRYVRWEATRLWRVVPSSSGRATRVLPTPRGGGLLFSRRDDTTPRRPDVLPRFSRFCKICLKKGRCNCCGVSLLWLYIGRAVKNKTTNGGYRLVWESLDCWMIVQLICFPTSYGTIYVCFHSWFCRICSTERRRVCLFCNSSRREIFICQLDFSNLVHLFLPD